MTATLLEQLVAEECSAYVRSLLVRAIADPTVVRPHFELDRFEVTVEPADDVVIVEDVLDATEAGVQTIPLSDFVKAINRWSR